ncbi:protein amnionless-like [Harmonia axyridis]|uniref:protein amnionless-like n=1 Tax=Harmonia axyridis TaxID=115357 RepID=UPI001E275274|nr:protein amnionless-like [Harmonia axyridis]
MRELLEMDLHLKFHVLCSYFSVLILECLSEEHVKIWKPNNDILNRENWVDPNSNEKCKKVEFGETNTASIYIKELTASEFLLPLDGNLIFLDDGDMKVVDEDFKGNTNCLKLKGLTSHLYSDPRNWESDVADNPAVPDREKLPCRDDLIKFPNEIYSSIGDMVGLHIVSAIAMGNVTHDFNTAVDVNPSARLVVSKRKCFDPEGCVCNDASMDCPPAKEPECLAPIHPKGFCHSICGAYTTFKPAPGFSLKKVRDALEEYSDVYTHVSKVDDDVIQVVFAEKGYSGDSVLYADKFYEKLQEKHEDFKIMELKSLKKSGSQTTGNASVVSELILSLLFVLGLFGLIFCVYGDRRWLTNFRFRNPSTFPLTSTYRARFSSRDDESGLIFDTQSIAGSVLNLRQSFDNPMFSEDKTDDQKKTDTCEASNSEEKPIEKNDPLFNLKRLNEELKDEIGSDIMQDLPQAINLKTSLVNDIPPLIEVEEIDGE